jgi:hypothetical protein
LLPENFRLATARSKQDSPAFILHLADEGKPMRSRLSDKVLTFTLRSVSPSAQLIDDRSPYQPRRI